MHKFVFAIALLITAGKSFASDSYVFAVSSTSSEDSSLEDLQYSDSDALKFVETLVSVGNVARNKAMIATKPTVRLFWKKANKALAEISKSNDKSSKFIFYYSGHSNGRGLQLKDGMITKKKLHSYFESIPVDTKIIIFDSCFSGDIAKKGLEPDESFELPKMEYDEPSGSVFLAASSSKEFAFESKELQGSVFSHYLIAGLYGEADSNNDSLVTIDEIYQFVYRETKLHSLSFPSMTTQKPEFVSQLQGKGAVVMSFLTKTKRKLKLSKNLEGDFIVASKNGFQMLEFNKDAGIEKTLLLPKGKYKVQVQKTNYVGNTEIDFTVRKRLALAKTNFDWKKSDLSRSKGDANPFLFGATFGVNGGHQQQRPGPLFELSLRSPKSMEFGLGWRLSAHIAGKSNEIKVDGEDVSKARSDEIDLMGGVNGQIKGFAKRQHFEILAAGGQSLIFQEYKYRSGESDRFKAQGPIGALGFAAVMQSKASHYFGLDYRLEAARITTSDDQKNVRINNTLGLSWKY